MHGIGRNRSLANPKPATGIAGTIRRVKPLASMAMVAKAIQPLNLRHTAGAIARSHGDRGAIVITLGEDGLTRVGVENLTPGELREALCTAIHYSFVFADQAAEEPDETA
jgi:hypothetical protein